MTDARAAAARLRSLLDRALIAESTAPVRPGDLVRVPATRFARALLDGRILPLLSDPSDRDPGHVVLFGGTNGGKSTVSNLLLGGEAAAMDTLARHTQLPEAFHPGEDVAFLDAFPSRLPGYARYAPGSAPRRTDEALRAGGFEPGVVLTPHAPGPFVVWDTPDVSTEEGMRFLPGVIDVLGLADLVLFVVTKESYADHRGRLLRTMVLDAGIPALVVVNKFDGGTTLLDDVRRKVAGVAEGAAGDHPAVGPDRVHPLPSVSGTDELQRLRALADTDAARALVARVRAEVATPAHDRVPRVRTMLAYLDRNRDDLLLPLADEVAMSKRWQKVVAQAQIDLLAAYRRSYLDGQRYDEFNLAVARFLDLLELPGPGRMVSRAASLIRKPMRAAMSGVRSAFGGGSPAAPGGHERPAVDEAVDRFLAAVRGRAESLSQEDPHPRWRALSATLLDPEFAAARHQAVDAAYPEYRQRVDQAVARRSRKLLDMVEKRPNVRRALQGSKLVLDAAATVSVVLVGGLDPSDLVIAPLVAPVLRILLEAIGHEHMEGEKRALKDEQLAALGETLARAVIDPTAEALHSSTTADELRDVRGDLQTLQRTVKEMR
jgi:hypothetical protein